MFSSTRSLAYLVAVVAVAATACSAPEARPAAVALSSAVAVPLVCDGGTVKSAVDAARFAGCEAVLGDLRIIESDLTDLSDFRGVRRVTGSVVVADNAKLISLAGLKDLESARSVEIVENPMLAGFYGVLPSLQRLEQPLVLRSNRGLSQREAGDVLERAQAVIQSTDERAASL